MNALVPACFAAYPGAVLRLSADGCVLETNGRLDDDLGRDLTGCEFGDVLDPGSSGLTWARDLRAGATPGTRELVFVGSDTLAEPRPFAIMHAEDGIWLVEQRVDPRLDSLRELVTDVNAELANTQRDLLKEQGRLRRALGELERSNRALDEFAYVISHDLKAPLRAIVNYAEWLQEDAAADLGAVARGHLDRLRSRADRMRQLIDGVLEYARAGRDDARPAPVDVGALVRDVADLLDTSNVTVDIAADLPTMQAARAPLQQVFINLLGNAVRFAGRAPGGRVRVTASDVGPCWLFEVADNGPGIPKAMQPRIWRLFGTLEPDDEASTGIGLAVVRQVVELHGGTIDVHSEEGVGATFRFRWPKQPRRGTAGGTVTMKPDTT